MDAKMVQSAGRMVRPRPLDVRITATITQRGIVTLATCALAAAIIGQIIGICFSMLVPVIADVLPAVAQNVFHRLSQLMQITVFAAIGIFAIRWVAPLSNSGKEPYFALVMIAALIGANAINGLVQDMAWRSSDLPWQAVVIAEYRLGGFALSKIAVGAALLVGAVYSGLARIRPEHSVVGIWPVSMIVLTLPAGILILHDAVVSALLPSIGVIPGLQNGNELDFLFFLSLFGAAVLTRLGLLLLFASVFMRMLVHPAR